MSMLGMLLFGVSLVLLAGGAELVVAGGVRLARILRVSALLIGMVVVGFGTSAPELVVSVMASYRGDSDIALGNVIGSNIFNIVAILGPVTLLAPLAVNRSVVTRETPIMLGVSVLMVLLALNGVISRIEGLFLLAGIVAYIVFGYRTSRAETVAEESAAGIEAVKESPARILYSGFQVVVGLVLLVIGARLLVDAAVAMARDFGISERVIALTLVSGGTSVPELATSLMAGLRKQRDIALGNILGSNVFNTLAILGAAALARAIPVAPEVLWFDIPVMMAAAVAVLVMAMTGQRISRWEGGLLFGGYIVYVTALVVMDAPVPPA